MNFAQRNWTNQQHFGSVTNHLHSYIEIMSSASESISFLLHNLSVMNQVFFSSIGQFREQNKQMYITCTAIRPQTVWHFVLCIASCHKGAESKK